jgi:intracellular septation protein A
MNNLWHAGRELLLDFAATLLFLALYALTSNTYISVGAGLALAFGQIGWHLIRRNPVDTMQWISLLVVVLSGVSALVTNNPVFVLIKPSIFYGMTGFAMLKRGWMTRYMPPRALEFVPDMVIGFGYVWAGLMFVSAGVNMAVALTGSVTHWVYFMSIYGTASKLGLFGFQFGLMKLVGRRRYLRQTALPAAA